MSTGPNTGSAAVDAFPVITNLVSVERTGTSPEAASIRRASA